DPLNKERRFIPLRLDDTPIKGSLAQFLYINWLPETREQAYAKLLEACRPLRPQPPEANDVPFNETRSHGYIGSQATFPLAQMDCMHSSVTAPARYDFGM